MNNTQKKIWLSSPHMGGGELKFIKQAFDENWVAPLGPNVNRFEKDLQNYLQKDLHVACLSSGTAALHLALILAGVSQHDEVICQSMTFSASANSIVYQGARPVFVDSEPQTWNMCPNALESAIKNRLEKGRRLKAVIVVHLYGMPANMQDICAVTKKYNLPLIEDAAEALGSGYQGENCGTFGDYAVLSFNGNKIITTSGGGALICRTKEEKDRAVFLSTQARDDAPHYQHSHIGYNYRMSNIVAGIGRGQMEVLTERIAQRRENHIFYKKIFCNIDGVEVFSEPTVNYFSNYWLSCILVDEKIVGFSRENLRIALLKENIESRPLWKPMHLQPVFSHAPYYGGQVAESLFERGLCLPSGSNMSIQDKERVKKAITEFK